MIVSGQLSREAALKELEQPIYDESEMEQNIKHVLEKIEMTREELDRVMQEPVHQHADYQVSRFPDSLRKLAKFVRRYKKN